MPIYEYKCANSHRFELKQSYLSEPVATCPTCDTKAKRVISPVPVHFKGSGFYVNDYSRKGSTSESSSDTSESSKSEASDSKESVKASTDSTEEK